MEKLKNVKAKKTKCKEKRDASDNTLYKKCRKTKLKSVSRAGSR